MKYFALFLLFILPQWLSAQKVVVLSVKQPPELVFTASRQDTTILIGNQVVLGSGLTISGGSGVYSYKWSPATDLSDSVVWHPVATPSDTTVYVLTVTDSNGCSFSVDYQVNVVPSGLTIDLKAGWNIISLNVMPAHPDVMNVFLPLINNKMLVKIQDESGNSLEDLGVFGGWTNNIGNTQFTEGYKIKVNSACRLNLAGSAARHPFPIPLKTGWNIIGYPRFQSADGMALVLELINRGKLVKVQDESGNSIEDYGVFGGWINNIGNFLPGRGYKIKVNAADTLTIFESYPKSSASPMSYEMPLHFKPANQGNGVDHMNINLVAIPGGLLEPGDEIAVFDENLCVWSAVIGYQSSVIGSEKSQITNHKSQITNLSIPVSSSEGTGCPGFTEGHPVVLKLRKAQTDTEYTLTPEIISGSSTFVKHESLFASLARYSVTGIGKTGVRSEMEVRLYPNPNDGKFKVQLSGAPAEKVELTVADISGKVITQKSIYNFPGNQIETFSVRLISGVYTLKAVSDKTVVNKQFIIQ